MKVIVVGNGIDIQFGGIDRRGNKAIIERAIANIESVRKGKKKLR